MSRGKGYKSGKRCAKLAEASIVEVARINQRMKALRGWFDSDRVSELRTEGRKTT